MKFSKIWRILAELHSGKWIWATLVDFGMSVWVISSQIRQMCPLFCVTNFEHLNKRFPGASRPQGRRSSKKSQQKDCFSSFFSRFLAHFQLFSDLFRAFLAPRPRGPGNSFSDFIRSFLGRGPFDPCGGQRRRNHRGTKIRVFRVCFQAPFLPSFFPSFFPPLPHSKPVPSPTPFPLFTFPFIPPFLTPEKL